MVKRERITLTLVALMCCIVLWAQEVRVEITFPKTTTVEGTEFYLWNEKGSPLKAQQMDKQGTIVSTTLEEAEDGFYSLTIIKNGGQAITPLYIPKGTTQKRLKAEMQEELYPVISNDKDCKVLSTFAYQQGMRLRQLWTEKFSDEQLKEMWGDWEGLIRQADPKGKASAPVKEYMRIWTYSQVHQALDNLPQILRKKPSEVTLKVADLLPRPTEVLDTPLATHIYYNGNIICDDLRGLGSLDERLAYLQSNYKTQQVRQMAQEQLMTDFVSGWDYQKRYTEGLVQLTEATKKYGLSDTYLQQFKERSSTLIGSEFPSNVLLTDRDGKKHDFSEFRGKLVYVDMWASWCIPCCMEVPHLQQLEPKVEGDSVAFLSISLDSSREPWLNRMKDLNMQGNQWLCTDTKLPEQLNIQGIPMFLIYDREGRLLVYDAPRPSSGEVEKLLNSLK